MWVHAAKAVSFILGTTTAYLLNRRFTFAAGKGAPAAEWLRFLGANALGGAVNYGVYAALVAFTAAGAAHPVLGVAAGSAAGLASGWRHDLRAFGFGRVENLRGNPGPVAERPQGEEKEGRDGQYGNHRHVPRHCW